jgi:hypothetical protein
MCKASLVTFSYLKGQLERATKFCDPCLTKKNGAISRFLKLQTRFKNKTLETEERKTNYEQLGVYLKRLKDLQDGFKGWGPGVPYTDEKQPTKRQKVERKQQAAPALQEADPAEQKVERKQQAATALQPLVHAVPAEELASPFKVLLFFLYFPPW